MSDKNSHQKRIMKSLGVQCSVQDASVHDFDRSHLSQTALILFLCLSRVFTCKWWKVWIRFEMFLFSPYFGISCPKGSVLRLLHHLGSAIIMTTIRISFWTSSSTIFQSHHNRDYIRSKNWPNMWSGPTAIAVIGEAMSRRNCEY